MVIAKVQALDFWQYSNIRLYFDHNPITFLTETTPKSSKLMRWALALQEFDVIFVIELVFRTLQPTVLAVMSARDDGR